MKPAETASVKTTRDFPYPSAWLESPPYRMTSNPTLPRWDSSSMGDSFMWVAETFLKLENTGMSTAEIQEWLWSLTIYFLSIPGILVAFVSTERRISSKGKGMLDQARTYE